MNVVGIGKGCKIADKFNQYPQYNIFKIDDENESSNNIGKFHKLRKYNNPEQYEQNCPNLKRFFGKLKEEVIFIIVGGSKVSLASLSILEQIKDNEITILYIKPEAKLSDTKEKIYNTTFHILQEYARSNLFKKIVLIDNKSIEEILKDTIKLSTYYDQINNLIVNTYHIVNVLSHNKPLATNNIRNTISSAKIQTIGMVDFNTGAEKLFYPLDSLREVVYIYALSKDENQGVKLLEKVRNQTEKRSKFIINGEAGYEIYPTNYDQTCVYSIAKTSEIQRRK